MCFMTSPMGVAELSSASSSEVDVESRDDLSSTEANFNASNQADAAPRATFSLLETSFDHDFARRAAVSWPSTVGAVT